MEDSAQTTPLTSTPETSPTQKLNQSPPTEQKPEKPKRKIPLLKMFVFGFVIIVTILAFGLIAYLIKGQNQEQNNQTVKTEVKALTPTPDPTANWETYTSSYDNFSVKYPPTLNVLEDENNGKKIRTFIQNSDFQIIIYPNGLTGKSSLEEYRNNLTSLGAKKFTPINIDGKNGYKYELLQKNESTIGLIFMNGGKLYQITVSPSNSQNITYLNQILSTFKFADQSADLDTSNWKTWTDQKYNFKFKYPSGGVDAYANEVGSTPEYIYITKEPSTIENNFIISLKIKENQKNLTLNQILNNGGNPLGGQDPTGVKYFNYGFFQGYELKTLPNDLTPAVNLIQGKNYGSAVFINKNNIFLLTVHDGNGEVGTYQEKLLNKMLSTFKFNN